MTLDPRFTPTLITMAQASHAKFYPRGPFVSISLAQWAVESGYGKFMSGEKNPFGILQVFGCCYFFVEGERSRWQEVGQVTPRPLSCLVVAADGVAAQLGDG